MDICITSPPPKAQASLWKRGGESVTGRVEDRSKDLWGPSGHNGEAADMNWKCL